MSTKVDLDLVERNLHNGNYLQEQLKPALLDAIARIRELEAALDNATGLLESCAGRFSAMSEYALTIKYFRDVRDKGLVLT